MDFGILIIFGVWTISVYHFFYRRIISVHLQEEKHKDAALKNAYVLMGKHQLELATAFFLLGGDPISAISICAKTLGDEQLALVICRLLEGYGGALEQHLISKILLPAATEKGDHWLASILEVCIQCVKFLIVLTGTISRL